MANKENIERLATAIETSAKEFSSGNSLSLWRISVVEHGRRLFDPKRAKACFGAKQLARYLGVDWLDVIDIEYGPPIRDKAIAATALRKLAQ